MKEYEAKLIEDFCCLKCRRRSAVAKTLPVSAGLPHLFVVSSDRYLFVTCTSCGFTEIYNPLVFAREEEASLAIAGTGVLQSQ